MESNDLGDKRELPNPELKKLCKNDPDTLKVKKKKFSLNYIQNILINDCD